MYIPSKVKAVVNPDELYNTSINSGHLIGSLWSRDIE